MWMRKLGPAWLAGALLALPVLCLAQGQPSAGGRLQQFEQTLLRADRHLGRAFSDNIFRQAYITQPNPYASILQMLKRSGGESQAIPPAWQARALTRYAAYLRISVGPGGKGHPAAWYRERMFQVLHRATKVDPTYGGAWVVLACLHENDFVRNGSQKFIHYLAKALQFAPLSADAQGMRTLWIWGRYGGHGIKNGSRFTGKIGFESRKWAKAFRYRALMYLWCLKKRGDVRGYWPPVLNVGLVTIALKYYAPRQLAELDAAVWKPPAKCPDPWPPPLKKTAKAPATTRP